MGNCSERLLPSLGQGLERESGVGAEVREMGGSTGSTKRSPLTKGAEGWKNKEKNGDDQSDNRGNVVTVKLEICHPMGRVKTSPSGNEQNKLLFCPHVIPGITLTKVTTETLPILFSKFISNLHFGFVCKSPTVSNDHMGQWLHKCRCCFCDKQLIQHHL